MEYEENEPMDYEEETRPMAYEEIDSYANEYSYFYVDEWVSKFIIKDVSDYPEEDFKAMMDKIIDKAFENGTKDGREPKMFGFLLFSSAIDNPINLPARTREELTSDLILNQIDRVNQSSTRKINIMDTEMQVIITTVNPPEPEGSGRPKAVFHFPISNKDKKRAIIPIANEDRHCLFYALEVAREVIERYDFFLQIVLNREK
jgi:hypothetical protein